MSLLNWHPDSLEISVIILFAKKENADVFFKEIYPLWTDPIIISEDGFYPENSLLKEKVLNELKTNPTLPIIVFSLSSYIKMKILSKNILNAEGLIKKDSYRFGKIKPFNWTAHGITVLLYQFAYLNSSLLRPSNDDELWHKKVNPESLDWYHKLIL